MTFPNIHAILIDPFDQTITEIEMSPNVAGLTKAVGGTVHATFPIVRGDNSIFFDNGFIEDERFFRWRGIEAPIAGKAVIVGTGLENATLSLDEVTDRVEFLPDYREEIPA